MDLEQGPPNSNKGTIYYHATLVNRNTLKYYMLFHPLKTWQQPWEGPQFIKFFIIKVGESIGKSRLICVQHAINKIEARNLVKQDTSHVHIHGFA